MVTSERSSLCEADSSLLVLVDIQARLIAAMPEQASSVMLGNTTKLLDAATLLAIPVLVSEQYPQGLGRTVASITQGLPAVAQSFEKSAFSCYGSAEFMRAVNSHGRRQIIVAGLETHICVLQTALELHASGLQVFVIGDACCARNSANGQSALTRLGHAGVIVSNTESVLFEWLRHADHEHFKKISALIR
ncbi:MAG: hydrolase [Gammaproteobacteria bacterium]